MHTQILGSFFGSLIWLGAVHVGSFVLPARVGVACMVLLACLDRVANFTCMCMWCIATACMLR